MTRSMHTVRDDRHYVVLVGWEEELGTFFAYVFDRLGIDGEPVLAVGQNQREIRTTSRPPVISCRPSASKQATASP